MRFGLRADVHVVEGSPWAEAIISVLSARSPYRPWRTDDSAPIRPGDKLIAVVDTDPVSVLAAVAVVGADGDVQAAFGGTDPFQWRGLLELGTLNMIARLNLPPMATPIYGRGKDVVEAIGAHTREDVDARCGLSTLAQARILLASEGRCGGCDGQVDLVQPDAANQLHIHTVASHGLGDHDYEDWPAVLCEACHRRMVEGGFTRFVDYRFSLAPACPSCGAYRSMAASYGMPAGGPIQEPWIAGMGCVVRPVEWVCGACHHEWGSGDRHRR